MITSTKSPDFKDGLWTASNDEERWSGYTFHDTREEAIVEYYGENGELPSFVGQVTIMTDEEIAKALLRDQQDADEAIGFQDEWVWYDDQIIDYTKNQFDELFSLVLGWVRKYNINPKLWYVMGKPVTETLEDLGITPPEEAPQ